MSKITTKDIEDIIADVKNGTGKSPSIEKILEGYDPHTSPGTYFLDGVRHGADLMKSLANDIIKDLENERDEFQEDAEDAENDLKETKDELYEAEIQAENAPIVENLADEQKAEIAKRLVANCTIEEMEAMEEDIVVRRKGTGYTYHVPADFIMPYRTQQLVDSQH